MPLRLQPQTLRCRTNTVYRLPSGPLCMLRVRWAADGSAIASGSDDRTLRLWSMPEAVETPGDKSAQPQVVKATHVLWGHTGRLWDIAFGDSIIVTASEDCSCRCGLFPSPLLTHPPPPPPFSWRARDLACREKQCFCCALVTSPLFLGHCSHMPSTSPFQISHANRHCF